MKWKQLSKEDTTIYKGIAILMIIIHNFMHLFPYVKQNEHSFHEGRFSHFLLQLWNKPEEVVQFTFSFFGHHGVQIFIFLSAYGLTKKYMNQELNYFKFMKSRILKIYPLFLWAIIFYLLIIGFYFFGDSGVLKFFFTESEAIFFDIILISNFIPKYEMAPVAPWWFISFIFQFYIIFPFVLKAYSKWGKKALIILSLITITFTLLMHGKIGGVRIYLTVIANFPEFALAIYIAKNDTKEIKMPKSLLLFAIVFYVIGNIYEPFWYITHLMILIILLFILQTIVPIINRRKILTIILSFIGTLSMALFLVNGFSRSPFIDFAVYYNSWWKTIILSLLSLSVSIIISLLLVKTEKYTRGKIGIKTFIVTFTIFTIFIFFKIFIWKI